MSKRDEQHFAEIHHRAQWAANFHGVDFAIYVSCRAPDEYSLTREEWLNPNELAKGTSFYTVKPISKSKSEPSTPS